MKRANNNLVGSLRELFGMAEARVGGGGGLSDQMTSGMQVKKLFEKVGTKWPPIPHCSDSMQSKLPMKICQ